MNELRRAFSCTFPESTAKMNEKQYRTYKFSYNGQVAHTTTRGQLIARVDWANRKIGMCNGDANSVKCNYMASCKSEV